MHIFLILNQDGGRLTWTNFLTSSECIPEMEIAFHPAGVANAAGVEWILFGWKRLQSR